MPHLVCLCSKGQAGTFLPGRGTWGLCRVFFLPVWYPCDEAIHSSLLWLQAPLSDLWSCAAALHGGGARHWFLVVGVEPGFAGSQLGEAQTWTLRGKDSGSMRERPGQKPSGGGDGLEVNWGATERPVLRKHGRGCFYLALSTQGEGPVVWATSGATVGGPVLMPLTSSHSAGHFWFPLFLQGVCTKMCLLCPSYPPCTGRNHSPGDDQVPGPAGPARVGPRS